MSRSELIEQSTDFYHVVKIVNKCHLTILSRCISVFNEALVQSNKLKVVVRIENSVQYTQSIHWLLQEFSAI